MSRSNKRIWCRLRAGRRCGTVVASGAATLLLCRGALAEPLVELLVTGNCPSRMTLEMALRARMLGVGSGSFLLDVQSTPGAALLRLKGAAGNPLVERTLHSEDCAALGAAAAVIVEGYFIEIGSIPSQQAGPRAAPKVPADSRQLPEPEEALPSASAPIEAPRVQVDSSVTPPRPTAARSAASLSSAAASLSPPPPPASAPEPAPQPGASSHSESLATTPAGPASHEAARRPRRLPVGHLLGGGGIEMLPDPGQTSAVFRLGAGWVWRTSAITSRIDLSTATPTVQAFPDRVWRWASRATVRLGIRVGSSLPVEPWVGLGVSHARIRARDLPDAATGTQWSAVVELGFGVEHAISRSFGLRADLSCYLLGNQEVYQIAPDGEVGRGPRLGCLLAPGLVWSPAPPSSSDVSTRFNRLSVSTDQVARDGAQ